MITTDVYPSSPPPAQPSRWFDARWVRIVLITVGVLVAAYLLLVVTNRSDIARGTTVLGVDIGGQSTSEATTTLERELAARAAAPILVTVAGRSIEVDPAQSGLSLDARATAEAAESSTYNPVSLVLSYFREPTSDPVPAVDDAALAAAVTGIAGQVDQVARDGDVSFNGVEIVTVEPLQGRALVQADATTTIVESYLQTDDAVELAVEETTPPISAAEVARAVRDFAQPAVSGPVTLALGDKATVEVAPETLLAHVDLVAQGTTLTPTVDAPALKAALVDRLGAAETAPVDARFDLSGGTPVIVPSSDGTSVTEQALGDAVLIALPSTTDRTAEVALQTTAPALSTAQAEALGVREQVSTFTTNFPAGQPRVTNIQRGAAVLDGTLVLPGETFSLNGVLGERTAAKGYVEAPAIFNGRLVKDIGGGVSQIATTTFNAVFFAGLQDVYHKPHSFYISRYPVGREATVDYPSVDLKFKNDAPTAILIDTATTGSSISVTFWGTKQYEIEAITGGRSNERTPQTIYDASAGCVPQSPQTGFTVTVTRVFKQGGAEVKREDFKTVYNAEDRVYCRAQAPAAPPPPTPPAPTEPAPVPTPPPPTT